MILSKTVITVRMTAISTRLEATSGVPTLKLNTEIISLIAALWGATAEAKLSINAAKDER